MIFRPYFRATWSRLNNFCWAGNHGLPWIVGHNTKVTNSQPKVAVAKLPPSQTMGIGSSRTHRSRQEAVGLSVLPKTKGNIFSVFLNFGDPCMRLIVLKQEGWRGQLPVIQKIIPKIIPSMDTFWLVVQACIWYFRSLVWGKVPLHQHILQLDSFAIYLKCQP